MSGYYASVSRIKKDNYSKQPDHKKLVVFPNNLKQKSITETKEEPFAITSASFITESDAPITAIKQNNNQGKITNYVSPHRNNSILFEKKKSPTYEKNALRIKAKGGYAAALMKIAATLFIIALLLTLVAAITLLTGGVNAVLLFFIGIGFATFAIIFYLASLTKTLRDSPPSARRTIILIIIDIIVIISTINYLNGF